jgi:hypothetical protein
MMPSELIPQLRKKAEAKEQEHGFESKLLFWWWRQ